MKSSSYRFPKAARVHLRTDISSLFLTGKSISAYPLKGVYIRTAISGEWPIQVAVSVPKRIFKKAVDRNRIKRQIREIVRLHHHRFSEILLSRGKGVQLMFIFTGKESPEYAVLQSKIILILQRLMEADELAVV
jgi:ribonuclease P protein component